MTTNGAKTPLQIIGARGLVVHQGPPEPNEPGTYGFYSDNEEQTWRDFPVTLKDFATQRGFTETDVEALVRTQAPIAVLGKTAKTYLVNLNALPNLGASKGRASNETTPTIAADTTAYLILEKDTYYAVAENILTSLEALDAGEAKIAVARGAVAAAIPDNGLPYGTNCVLLNLSQLVPAKAKPPSA